MLTKTSTFTLKALVELSRLKPGERAGAAALAKAAGAPEHYLGKVLRKLSYCKILNSRNGLHGGFCLAKKPEDISLYEVIGVIEDLSRLEGCFMDIDGCSKKHPCMLHNRWGKLRGHFIQFLKSTTLNNIIGKERSRK